MYEAGFIVVVVEPIKTEITLLSIDYTILMSAIMTVTDRICLLFNSDFEAKLDEIINRKV